MATKKQAAETAKPTHLRWDEQTERRARRLMEAKGQTLIRVVADALELAEIRYEAEQAALRLYNAGKRRPG